MCRVVSGVGVLRSDLEPWVTGVKGGAGRAGLVLVVSKAGCGGGTVSVKGEAGWGKGKDFVGAHRALGPLFLPVFSWSVR